MKLINGLIAAWLLFSVPFAGTSAQENKAIADSYFLHTVLKGQSLYSIASMYGVTQNDIIQLNPGCKTKILAGQTLRIPQNQQQSGKFHTIQAQETLYQLTVKYGITAQKICEANPGLSAGNFKIGQVIVIPTATDEKQNIQLSAQTQPAVQKQDKRDGSSRCRDIHKVKRKETIYSVSREYGISKEELIAANPELKKGMKKGMFLCIPYPQNQSSPTPHSQIIAETGKSNTELFANNEEQRKRITSIRAAIILPFTPEGANSAESMRMTEYYEGFLMAADSLKRKGVSMELYVYNSGNEKNSIHSLLDQKELKDMHIIFGPMHTSHIKPLAEFAKKNDIHLVIPFTSKGSVVFNTPNVYQINTPQSYLYSEVYEHFIRKFNKANVIFLEADKTDKEKAEFIEGLQHELKTYGIAYQTIAADATSANFKDKLVNEKENIFIPTSGSNTLLIKTLPQLIVLRRENPEQHISLFGYPEWQTYTKDHLESFYELDTYFYSSFYTNNLFPSAVNFTNSYRRWYGKDMVNSFPKFGMLGFDTAYFFLKALSQYGETFEKNIRDVQVTPIQTGFKFDRVNNWGGFINRKVFFVHFTPNYELIKIDFD